jgi:6-phosphogluconolactonase
MKVLIHYFLITIVMSTATAQSHLFVSARGKDNTHGIHLYKLVDGKIQLTEKSDAVAATSYLNFHPTSPFLYAVGDNKVFALKVDENTGHITLLNYQDSPGGPAYVSVDESGHYVFVANYGGATIAVYPINRDGSVGEVIQEVQHEGSSIDTTRQQKAHPHFISVSPGNKYVLVPDLGQDRIVTYKFDDSSGKLVENEFSGKALPGAGPRHLEFHPTLPFVFVVNELNSTVTSYTWDNNLGKMDQIATYPMLPDEFNEFSKAADIHLTSDGKFLYASNRGHNSLAAYRVADDGRLQFIDTYPCGGDFPRNFFITPDDRYVLVANQNTNNMVQYKIDAKTGALSMLQEITDIPGALCIKMR